MIFINKEKATNIFADVTRRIMKHILLTTFSVLMYITINAQEMVLDPIETSQEDYVEEEEKEEEEPVKLTPIEKAFFKLDLNADSTIEFREFQKCNMNTKSKSSNYSVKAMQLSKKFSSMDINSDRKIDIVEFETAMTPKKEKAYILKKLEIFSKIDANKDHRIDLHEFSRVKAIGRIKYYKEGKPEFREEKFAEIDTNDDGYINIEEFEIDKKLVSKKG